MVFWNEICDDLRNLWGVYWTTPLDQRVKIKKTIESLTDKLQKLHGYQPDYKKD